jgi:hypothetical protein
MINWAIGDLRPKEGVAINAEDIWAGTSGREPYLLAALVLFLTEVIIRRLKDYRKDRPVIEENPPRMATEVAE